MTRRSLQRRAGQADAVDGCARETVQGSQFALPAHSVIVVGDFEGVSGAEPPISDTSFAFV